MRKDLRIHSRPLLSLTGKKARRLSSHYVEKLGIQQVGFHTSPDLLSMEVIHLRL